MVSIYKGFGAVCSCVFRQIWHPVRCYRSRNRALVFIVTVDDVIINNEGVVVASLIMVFVDVGVVIVFTAIDIAYGLSLIQIHEKYVIIFIIFL